MTSETSRVDASSDLLATAIAIWKSGVEAVDSARLVSKNVQAWRGGIQIAGEAWLPREDSRICVVGAGKAGAGMAAGLEQALGPQWWPRLSGWVNVPADCVRPLQTIHLHPARPAGVNEPTPEGVAGTREILQRVQSLRPHDLCIVLLSGGGSALLPAPRPGLSLADKLAVTRTLMRGGATIAELNCVRRSLSEIKGGGLSRACRAGTLIALIISDVIGDPLETIASGPTISIPPDDAQALEILERVYTQRNQPVPAAVRALLTTRSPAAAERPLPVVSSHVIGNNRTAVEAAAAAARRQGYRVDLQEWDQAGQAAEAGRDFARRMCHAATATSARKLCLVSGGETTVQLAATDGPQKGGRNQEFTLAALATWLVAAPGNAALVSGGTDGEDGPTDAAGGLVDAQLLQRVRDSGIDPQAFLQVNNSYEFLEQFDALLKTGPTHTNVMDLRVGLIDA